MEATKTRFFAHEGVVTDERDVEDNAARLGAARLGAELAGVLTSVGAGQHHAPAQVLIILPRGATAPGMQVAEVDITECVTVHEPSVVNIEPIEAEVGVEQPVEPGGSGSPHGQA